MHGYHFQLVRHTLVKDRKGAWSKMIAAKQFLKDGFDWVWLLDLDTIITNHTRSLEDLIPYDAWYSTLHREQSLDTLNDPNRVGALVSFDCNGFNSGSMLLRSDPWTISFLDEAYHVYVGAAPSHWNDQMGFAIAYNQNAAHRSHFKIIPQNKFNAYETTCSGPNSTPWRFGDFIIHFAGFKGFKAEMTDEYILKRVGVFEDGLNHVRWDWMDSLQGSLARPPPSSPAGEIPTGSVEEEKVYT
ncbi:hypothetical protein HDV00_010110 [Rhizophlyctis rosea]|nr:hypothetical protein HDV00_010110 [Rhizophlyctis rosea]